ncbi:MAG: hypothetical protein CVV24_13660 [Ignavibacteriae bacterium HGW-Ignavibacteriae-3]|nr:MAG: hypothetical protein CVV24_13660 [Ignavibacteriae bacterium HGW-Ignavibacteriae-3]
MEKVFLEWTYIPKTYFENDIIVENDQIHLLISNGIAKMELKNYNPQIKASHQEYNNFIESHFISRMIENRIDYTIKEGATIIEHDDGHTEVILKPETITITVTLPNPKVKITGFDKDGNINYDSEEEERKKQQEFLSKIQNVLDKDEIVPHIIESYKNSIRFPKEELIYLYEIIDALQTYFKGKSEAIGRLKISTEDWSELGRICNNLPLKQGRHRGQMIGKLKDSKEGELEKARDISRKILRSFINYLNQS